VPSFVCGRFLTACSTIGELTSKVSQLEADSSAVDGLRDGIKGIDDAIDKVRRCGAVRLSLLVLAEQGLAVRRGCYLSHQAILC
jgi:hypothetical protein